MWGTKGHGEKLNVSNIRTLNEKVSLIMTYRCKAHRKLCICTSADKKNCINCFGWKQRNKTLHQAKISNREYGRLEKKEEQKKNT